MEHHGTNEYEGGDLRETMFSHPFFEKAHEHFVDKCNRKSTFRVGEAHASKILPDYEGGGRPQPIAKKARIHAEGRAKTRGGDRIMHAPLIIAAAAS